MEPGDAARLSGRAAKLSPTACSPGKQAGSPGVRSRAQKHPPKRQPAAASLLKRKFAIDLETLEQRNRTRFPCRLASRRHPLRNFR